MERGTVSMRVAFVLRSAEVQPLFRDLCDDNNDNVIIWLQTILHIIYISVAYYLFIAYPPPPIIEYHNTIQLMYIKYILLLYCAVETFTPFPLSYKKYDEDGSNERPFALSILISIFPYNRDRCF
jgi:hypothetical protein